MGRVEYSKLSLQSMLSNLPITPCSSRVLSEFFFDRIKYYYLPYNEKCDTLRNNFFSFSEPPLPEWLQDLITGSCNKFFSHVESVLEQLQRDHVSLSAIGITSNLIPPFDIKVGDSDLHDGCQFTFIIRDQSMQCIVFKSTKSNVFSIADELLREFVGPEVFVPQTLMVGGFTWQRYVPESPPSRDIFQSYGKLVFLSQMLHIYDLHPDNIIRSEQGLALIDLETIFCPIPSNGGSIVIDGKRSDMVESPLAGSLLPSWRRKVGGQLSLQDSVFSLLVKEEDFCEQLSLVVEGYISAYEKIFEVVQFLREFDYSDVLVRKMYRATGMYCLFVSIASSRAVWGEKSFKSELDGLLRSRITPADPVLELESLVSGDIPLHVTRLNNEMMRDYLTSRLEYLIPHRHRNVEIVRASLSSLVWDVKTAETAVRGKNYFLGC